MDWKKILSAPIRPSNSSGTGYAIIVPAASALAAGQIDLKTFLALLGAGLILLFWPEQTPASAAKEAVTNAILNVPAGGKTVGTSTPRPFTRVP